MTSGNDLIRRADAFEAVCESCELWIMHGLNANTECPYYANECAEIKALKAIPSADAEQVTGKLKNPCDSLLTEDSEERRVCCNCRNRRTSGVYEDKCMIDGHYIGYVQCFTNWCRHWATDELKWIGGGDD